ncbi:NUDIX hydrolase [Streptomyces narbonensis]|uniref:NUDIX hydrolase n=1 Tax=Streptomyces narbonensis TaxID=67333 RepID=UPI001677EFDC|nr:NUDIX hydrolase [Streptomyces narbonensis]GGV98171.1 DNA mismatch repair protein MutT [Streptomyces narbonensis]
MNGKPPVLAAGCVLWRPSPSGHGIEIAVIFRPKWSDWSHPKGKLKRGESALPGALREVREETGMTCEPGMELATVRYVTQGRPKEVRYWAAEATDGSFEANREVSRLLWLPPPAAQARLTRDHDKELVDMLLTVLRAGQPSRGTTKE